jgi:hypothetical protein
VTWSEDNIIAFTGPDGIYKGAYTNNPDLDEARAQLLHMVKGEPIPEHTQSPQSDNHTDLDTTMIDNAPEASEPQRRKSISRDYMLLRQASTNALSVPGSNVLGSSESSSLDNSAIPTHVPPRNEGLSAKFHQQRRQVATSGLTHVIFLLSPSFPSEHTTIVTPHRSRIK